MTGSPFQPPIAGELRQLAVDGDAVTVFGEERRARVAVCIPVRNAEATLERCLESVLGAGGPELRVVVVDNASTDGTFALACARAASDARVVVYRNPRDIGRIANWNRCLALAGDADYVKLLMVGDVLLPGFLAESVAMMDAFPSAALLRASLSFRHADGHVDFLPHFDSDRLIPGEEARRSSLVDGNIAAGPSGQLWRHTALGGLAFDEALPWAADYDFSLRLLRRGDFAYLRRKLYLFDLGAQRFHSAAEPRRSSRTSAPSRSGTERPTRCHGSRRCTRASAAGRSSTRSSTRRAPRSRRSQLDTRGVSLLLVLEGDWEDALRAYVDEIGAEEDVTLVLKPAARRRPRRGARRGRGRARGPRRDARPALRAERREPDRERRRRPLPRRLAARARPRRAADDAAAAAACPRRDADRRRRARHARHPPPPRVARLPRAPDVPRLQGHRRRRREHRARGALARRGVRRRPRLVPEGHVFRPGGIWKKITDQWQEVESEYVAYFHYDDLWDTTKLAEQVALIESRALNGCYTSGLRIDDDGRRDAGRHRAAGARPVAGRHASGRVDAALDAAAPRRHPRLGPARARAELGGDLRAAVLPLRPEARPRREVHDDPFFYREHPATISNTVREEEAFVEDARAETGYTLEATLADAEAIDLDGLAARLVADAA